MRSGQGLLPGDAVDVAGASRELGRRPLHDLASGREPQGLTGGLVGVIAEPRLTAAPLAMEKLMYDAEMQ
jgi:hypothetical protein